MVFLKDDGSLDVDRINKLTLEEYMDMMGNLTQEQVREYLTKLPVNESKEPMKAVIVDYTLDEELERGAVIAEDLINNLKKKRMTNETIIDGCRVFVENGEVKTVLSDEIQESGYIPLETAKQLSIAMIKKVIEIERSEHDFSGDSDAMLRKLKEQEARIIAEDKKNAPKGPIKLSPKIDVEECLRNGYITAEEYERTHR